jgi:hypothetical protein
MMLDGAVGIDYPGCAILRLDLQAFFAGLDLLGNRIYRRSARVMKISGGGAIRDFCIAMLQPLKTVL